MDVIMSKLPKVGAVSTTSGFLAMGTSWKREPQIGAVEVNIHSTTYGEIYSEPILLKEWLAIDGKIFGTSRKTLPKNLLQTTGLDVEMTPNLLEKIIGIGNSTEVTPKNISCGKKSTQEIALRNCEKLTQSIYSGRLSRKIIASRLSSTKECTTSKKASVQSAVKAKPLLILTLRKPEDWQSIIATLRVKLEDCFVQSVITDLDALKTQSKSLIQLSLT